MTDEDYMEQALAEAWHCSGKGEIPIGAVIVKDGKIIASAGNSNRAEKDPTRHAEIKAIQEAAEILGNERLTGCEMFVTKEPCAMCAGAIVHARIKRLVIGAEDARYGACGTVLSVCGNSCLNHIPETVFGIKKEECAELLKKFFMAKRASVKK